MLFAATLLTLHDVAILVLRVLVAPMSFPGRMGAVAFTNPPEERKGVTLVPHECASFSLRSTESVRMVMFGKTAHFSPKASYWSSNESPPIPLAVPVGHVEAFRCLCVVKAGHIWKVNTFLKGI